MFIQKHGLVGLAGLDGWRKHAGMTKMLWICFVALRRGGVVGEQGCTHPSFCSHLTQCFVGFQSLAREAKGTCPKHGLVGLAVGCCEGREWLIVAGKEGMVGNG